jgi:hypothetical protein
MGCVVSTAEIGLFEGDFDIAGRSRFVVDDGGSIQCKYFREV